VVGFSIDQRNERKLIRFMLKRAFQLSIWLTISKIHFLCFYFLKKISLLSKQFAK